MRLSLLMIPQCSLNGGANGHPGVYGMPKGLGKGGGALFSNTHTQMSKCWDDMGRMSLVFHFLRQSIVDDVIWSTRCGVDLGH